MWDWIINLKFLLQGSTSQGLHNFINSTTNWGLVGQAHEPVGDISHPKQHSDIGHFEVSLVRGVLAPMVLWEEPRSAEYSTCTWLPPQKGNICPQMCTVQKLRNPEPKGETHAPCTRCETHPDSTLPSWRVSCLPSVDPKDNYSSPVLYCHVTCSFHLSLLHWGNA